MLAFCSTGGGDKVVGSMELLVDANCDVEAGPDGEVAFSLSGLLVEPERDRITFPGRMVSST